MQPSTVHRPSSIVYRQVEGGVGATQADLRSTCNCTVGHTAVERAVRHTDRLRPHASSFLCRLDVVASPFRSIRVLSCAGLENPFMTRPFRPHNSFPSPQFTAATTTTTTTSCPPRSHPSTLTHLIGCHVATGHCTLDTISGVNQGWHQCKNQSSLLRAQSLQRAKLRSDLAEQGSAQRARESQ